MVEKATLDSNQNQKYSRMRATCVLFTQFDLFLIHKEFFLNRKKSFRRPGSLFLINLAVADLCKASFNNFMVSASSLYGKWIFGQLGELMSILYKPNLKL